MRGSEKPLLCPPGLKHQPRSRGMPTPPPGGAQGGVGGGGEGKMGWGHRAPCTGGCNERGLWVHCTQPSPCGSLHPHCLLGAWSPPPWIWGWGGGDGCEHPPIMLCSYASFPSQDPLRGMQVVGREPKIQREVGGGVEWGWGYPTFPPPLLPQVLAAGLCVSGVRTV